MAYAVSAIGVNVTDVWTPYTTGAYQESTNNPPHTLGMRIIGNDNAEWVYCKAAAAITGAGYVCFFDVDTSATMVSASNDAIGQLLGVAMAAIPLGSYGWLQVKGQCGVQVLASAAANVQLYTQLAASAGILDDASAGVTGFLVDRIYLGTAQGGSNGLNTSGYLNYPQLVTAST